MPPHLWKHKSPAWVPGGASSCVRVCSPCCHWVWLGDVKHFLPVWSELQAEFQAWEEMTSY